MKLVLCGGHLTPALTLIEELEKHKDVKIVFFGRKHSTEGTKTLSLEYSIINKKKIKFYEITAGRLQRKFTKYTFLALFKIPVGFLQSFVFLLKERPNLVISFGGYLSVPVVLNGWFLGIKSIAHEQASIPGIASKINSLFVDKTYLSWKLSASFFDKEKIEVIGNLTSKRLFKRYIKDTNIRKFIKSQKTLIFVTGGNQGSHFINQLIFKALPKLKKFSVIHQVGKTNWKGDLGYAKNIKERNYFSIDYLEHEDIGAVLRKSSLVISRSGANTVWDLALLSKPAILIPLPISGAKEQQTNAKILENANMAQIISEDKATVDSLIKAINFFFRKRANFEKSAAKFSKHLQKDAVSKFTKAILRYT